ncbi:MAG: glycosyltransferase family 4 protein [Candidatus Sulfotelmatobacter sp.]
MTTNEMKPVKILVDSFADEGLTNAQMINAREIVSRLDSGRFSVTMFVRAVAASQILARPNTRLIRLPSRLQTIPMLGRFLFGDQDILFYLKGSPASRWYLKMRPRQSRHCTIVGTIESQTDWRDETITPQAIRLFENTVLRCDHLFSNSAMVKRSLEANYGLQSEIVPTGVDTEFFTPNFERPANLRPRVLFVGALRVFKGPQAVLDAAQRYPEADFVLVGEGLMRQELQDRARSLANVEMRGTLGRNEIREEYRRADIFMFPSRWEGSPRVLMEAAATGLPVLARKDYEPESVMNGATGFLASDDYEMMLALGRLLADGDLRRRLGKSGRSHIARFSWDVITRQWEAIFSRLAAVQRKGSQP